MNNDMQSCKWGLRTGAYSALLVPSLLCMSAGVCKAEVLQGLDALSAGNGLAGLTAAKSENLLPYSGFIRNRKSFLKRILLYPSVLPAEVKRQYR